MQKLNLVLTLLLGAFAAAGCGGSTASDPDGGVSGTGGAGGGTGGTTSTSCDVITTTAARVGLCAEASVCAKAQCPSELAACLGDTFATDTYAGRDCSEFASCVKACKCVETCVQNCTFSDTCSGCLMGVLLPAVIQSTCAGIAYQCYGGAD